MLPSSGATPEQCIDFDFAVLDFWDWFTAKTEEQKIGRIKGRQPGKRETWVKRYSTVRDILDLYHRQQHGEPVSPEVAAMTAEDIRSLIDEAFGPTM